MKIAQIFLIFIHCVSEEQLKSKIIAFQVNWVNPFSSAEKVGDSGLRTSINN